MALDNVWGWGYNMLMVLLQEGTLIKPVFDFCSTKWSTLCQEASCGVEQFFRIKFCQRMGKTIFADQFFVGDWGWCR